MLGRGENNTGRILHPLPSRCEPFRVQLAMAAEGSRSGERGRCGGAGWDAAGMGVGAGALPSYQTQAVRGSANRKQFR